MLMDRQAAEPKLNLSESKKALLEQRLRGTSGQHRDAVIKQRPTQDSAPLSATQRRLWYLYQMDPEGHGYNYSTALRISGGLEIPVVQKCVNEIVRRHEILRTTYVEENRQVVQRIASAPGVAVKVQDLSPLAESLREAEAIRLAQDDGQRPFNLAQGPVLRVTLLRLDDEAFVLLFTVHHIAYDGWSAGVLLSEFISLYETFETGQASRLPELPIQYGDFAYWQHIHLLNGPAFNRQLRYWQTQLDSIPTLLELPSDRPRPLVRSYRGRSYAFSIPPDLTERLRKTVRLCDCTLFSLLLGCFNALLHRYSGASDICVGIPYAGRTQSELEGLIGFFINTLVIRSKLADGTRFVDLVNQTRAAVIDAQSNAAVPFDKLVEELKPPHSPSYNPLFQMMFVLHNPPPDSMALGSIKLETLNVDYEVSKFDLVLHATEKELLEFSFEYSTELFDAERIVRLADYFKTILQVVADNPYARINDFEWLTASERGDILQWNATERVFPKDRLLHEGIEEQARNRPEAVAVCCGDQQLSYGELNRRANQLAHWLQGLGVGPEIRVGVCLERSIAMVVGVLAVLKAGGAYVPMHPSYPKERMASLLNDCNAPILLTNGKISAELSSVSPRVSQKIFCLDRDWTQLSELPDHTVSRKPHATMSAYVIYTSGSTGTPKGVVVSHANAVASTWARFDYYREPVAGFLLVSPLAFDSSVAGLFWTLSSGGLLSIPTEPALQDIEALAELIARDELSHLLCLPSFYNLMLDCSEPTRLQSLKTVIVAGEACMIELVAKHSTRLPHVQLYNEYGPTEAAVWSSVYAIQDSDAVPGRPMAIGRPIANTQLYVLDRHLNGVPIGVPGELYIGGAGLTRGYLGRPDLTAERFVPHPFGTASGSRLYKTGDRVRYRADGNIEFLGRIDHQIKIRGFRIEPGEIEAQMLQYPAVSEALVVARSERNNADYLAAYWVAEAGFDEGCFDKADLKQFLKSRLPGYMMPSVLMRLERLPRTATGKIDRNALPLPVRNKQPAFRSPPPRTPIENRLAEIWTELLHVEPIGIHDNFFELGGDSILAMQFVNRLRQDGLSIKPQQLSRYQTIAELTGLLADAAPQSGVNPEVSGEVPLTPIQHWFFEQNFPNPHHWNQALLLEARVPVDPDRLNQAIGQLVNYHDAFRLRFTRDETGWHQRYNEEIQYPVFHRVDLSHVKDAALAAELEQHASLRQKQLNITAGPLIQAVLFDTGKNRPARVLIVIHHLAVDGVSWRILVDDLETLYRHSDASGTVALPPKTTSYLQWSQHLQAWAQLPSVEQESAYWRDMLVHRPHWPVDNASGGNTEAMSTTITACLDAAGTKQLLACAGSKTGTVINEILLAALAKTLGAWSQSDRIPIDIDLHGRVDGFDAVDLSRSVGWFTSVFPLVIVLPNADDATALSAVKNQLLHIPNKGIGYGILRYLRGLPVSVKEAGNRYRSPVLFNYLGRLDQGFSKHSVFRLAEEPVGPCMDPSADRYNEFSIDAYISGGQLHILWTYSSERYLAETIQQLIHCFCQSILVLADENKTAQEADHHDDRAING